MREGAVPGLSPRFIDIYVCLCPNCLFLKGYQSHCIRAHTNGLILTQLEFKGPISKYSHILRSWGLGLQHVPFKGTHFRDPGVNETGGWGDMPQAEGSWFDFHPLKAGPYQSPSAPTQATAQPPARPLLGGWGGAGGLPLLPGPSGSPTLALSPLRAAGRPNLRVRRDEGGPWRWRCPKGWAALGGVYMVWGGLKHPFVLGCGRGGLSVQLPSHCGVGVWVAPGILFACRAQASGRLERRNLF